MHFEAEQPVINDGMSGNGCCRLEFPLRWVVGGLFSGLWH